MNPRVDVDRLASESAKAERARLRASETVDLAITGMDAGRLRWGPGCPRTSDVIEPGLS